MRILLAGATGLVGSHALPILLDDPRCTRVIAPTRRPLPLRHAKLDNPVLDFDGVGAAARHWQVDAAICALGTTMKQAGSREAFRRVDHDYPLALAQSLREEGTEVFVLNSAMGADVGSRFFYSRVKGELERDLRALRFGSLVLVRPGLIGGERAGPPRAGERIGMAVLGVLGPVLPRAWRINPAESIARAMVGTALQPPPGEHVIDSAQLAG
ncbi:NAD-dependent epimerase/dehydratase family protein [Stenotrophomonas sp. HITSZ_GD]|uniref:NAD-dependent epimerase/dehydratase family protein n=1 Tax=Stenotrophomonas sp. HITSZ_GD TaxID=3037248 RepID=UPI00240E45A7|nr:NAD-dependent epimerase/dehydratase family protein [Stenotrophomonas sp. HITSZ_GD]MDG2526079.1 NAD-dependent epimerase/dehydratase family protein [Stenotrophomonas sp. HITSZ_GD]